jgi:hypothetical protein
MVEIFLLVVVIICLNIIAKKLVEKIQVVPFSTGFLFRLEMLLMLFQCLLLLML